MGVGSLTGGGDAMRCPCCHSSDHDGPVCSCGLSSVKLDDATSDLDDSDYMPDWQSAYHSHLSRREAIAEARRLGDASEGDGWRRLIWRLATLLAGED
jgi:hypothetical protein